jgi:hypothetical protein
MDRNEILVNKRYDALMFARNTEEAKRAASQLIEAVLGESGKGVSIDEALRQVCRKIRPAEDSREQARFEAEFLELVFAPTGNGQTILAEAARTAVRQRAA